MSTARELWFVGPRQVEIRQTGPLPALVAGQVKARALCSGISQGTELLLYRGEGPRAFDPSLDEPSAPLFPRRYGYSWVGQVEDSRASGIEPGQRIFALRPHGDLHVVGEGQLHVLPPTVPSPRATLAANLETALNVVWDAGVAIGDEVVVLGGGMVGLLVARLAKRAGASHVHLVEPSPRRREAGLSLGADRAVPPDQDDPRAEADVVIEATGQPANLDRAILHAGEEATVVVASFYGERRSPVSLGEAFHRRRLRLVSSQVSRLPPGKSPRWDVRRRFERVLDLLSDDRLDLLLDPPVSFREAAGLFARLDRDASSSLQAILAYG
jgi:2-desacetyl-2-hydroxyethyl bacteriochlorophyllide A dehydrogenase